MPEWKAPIENEQSAMTREDVIEMMKARNDFIADMDNLAPQEHRWIDRGLIMSCENAGHPYHQTSKM